ncbi:MAG TPA: hypothetical protein VHA75_10185, partial [Rugosimonospora sp.]|nr:hypothetical protein [Rugosimonospora sp.]
MIRLILAALRHHRAQAVTVLVLATFAVAAAVASPWYVAGSADRAADVDLASATKSERLITVSRAVTVRDLGAAVSPVDEVGQAAAANVTIPGVSVVAGGYQTATIRVAGGTTNTTVAYRQDMCQHLTLAGRCPAAANETLLSTATAKRLDLRVGQQYAISPTFGDPQLVTLV